MPVTFRAAIAIALVLAFFLVKHQLEALQWTAGPKSDWVIDRAGAHVELVSGDNVAPAIAPLYSSVRASSSIPAKSATSTTSKRWEEPTGEPVTPAKVEPVQIPVQVPGEGEDWYWGQNYWDEDEDGYLNDYLDDMDDGMGRFNHNQEPKPEPPQVPKLTDRVVVLGRMSWEDSDWLDWELPEWPSAVYVVDDPDAEYSVQQNKGKESNVYLQYILDHYHKLPEYMVFLHAHRSSYHVEFEEQDNALTVQRLQLDYVRKAGYTNLRCDWGPGCPDEVQPFRQLAGRTTEIAFAGAWIRIFNNTNIPEIVGAPCCAQFAVTKKQVLARPLSDYQHYHDWLMETELDDETSGRVFEYLWHIIFGQDPVTCPTKEQCYWDVYGMEYVEPPIPDWISDNPFNEMSNWDDWDDEYGDDGYDDGYNFLDDDTEGLDEDAEGLEEEAEEEEEDYDDEAEKEYETKAETLAASKLEKSKLETPTPKKSAPKNEDEDDPFDLDGPLDDSDLDDSTDSDRDFSGPDLRKEILNKPLDIDAPPRNPKLEMF